MFILNKTYIKKQDCIGYKVGLGRSAHTLYISHQPLCILKALDTDNQGTNRGPINK